MVQVQAIYDFEAQPGSGELTLLTGDILNVTRQDVGDGWWEGMNQRGEQGLFPEAYVELTVDAKNESQAVLAERRRQLMRRHTCSVLDPEDGKGIGLPKSSSVSPKRSLASAAGGAPSSSVRRRGSSTRRKKSYEESAIPEEASDSPTSNKPSSINEENPQSETTNPAFRAIGGPPPDMPPPPLPDLESPFPASEGGFPSNGFSDPLPPPETHTPFSAMQTSFDTVNAGVVPNPPVEPVEDAFGYDDDWSDEDSVANHNLQEQPAGVSKGSSGRRSTRDVSTDDEDHSYTPAQRGRSGTNASSEREESREGSGSAQVSSRKASVKKRGSDANNYAPGGGRDLSRSGGDINRQPTVRKNMNRFSKFVTSGAEAYIINAIKVTTPPAETHEVILSRGGAEWRAPDKPYQVNVDKPKKESKLKGLKSFIAYQLTPSFTGIQVSRRYKHFDWLHQRLTEKYAFLPIPPLPEKQATGRYEEEFIEHRMHLLHLWVSKIVRHPVLSRSDVWIHFLTCTDEKKWKQGKRKAEKDEYIGGSFFLSLTVPPQPLDPAESDAKLENFNKLTRSLDDSIKGFHTCAGEASKRMAGPCKREWDKMGMAFKALGQSMEIDQAEQAQGITNAVKKASDSYYQIGKMYEEQPRKDLEPLQDNLFAYKGLLSSVPEILQVHKSGMSKWRDHEKLSQEGKLTSTELDSVRQRVDTMNYSILAEMDHFQTERVIDFKAMFSDYLRSQVGFYEQIVSQLKDALEGFERA